MSWKRGRGRGQGGYGFDRGFKSDPFVIFPEITLPDPKSIPLDLQLASTYFKFNRSWINSPYHLGDGVPKQENESLDIERYSDSLKPKIKSNKKGSFYDFVVLRPDNFPKELIGDTRRERPVKRAKWSQETDLQKLDVFEKLEAKYKAEGKEEKEGGEDDDEEVEESEGEESDNGDYDQNQAFDDDDDDYNQDDGDFEEVY